MSDPAATSDRSVKDDLTTADRLDGLKYRNIGPHRGGRVVAVAGHPHDPMVFYFGACAGGIWKTVDGGTFWECVSDGFLNTAAVGAIAVSESDPNVLYAGTGETTIRGDVSHGDGVYKSTDAGKTWTNVGLAATRHIAKIRIHPRNADLVYVAALGHAWGPNDERGLYRSKDGGATWEQILFRSNTAGAIDLSMDPNNPRILYCSFWEAQRTPYSMWSGGTGSSLYRSTDGGDTWTDISRNQGLPKGVLGKIGVAVSPARPDRVWALIEAEDGALCRSDDGGETWQRISENDDLRRRAWYYMHVFADPQDADVVWVLNLSCWKSIDGGANFTGVATPHGDNHDLWIDPNDTRRLIEGNDGGACVSFNGGNSWSTILNQPTAQFYHVTADTQVPYRVYGSQQDNTAISVASRSVHGVITETDWLVPGGGESGYIAVRPDAPYIQYAGDHRGFLTRTDQRTGQERVVDVWPEYFGMYEGADALKHRFQWTFPLFLSPFDPQVLYAAGECLFRSTDEGSSWEAISPDLTRHDAGTLKTSGGPITLDNTSAEVYATIFSAVESPHERGMFWVGTDDGLVHISRDGGTTWADITPPELKLPNGEWALISIIDLSAHDAATAYLAATRYKLDDVRPYLYKTNDFGASWTKITSGIPEDDFTRVIRADPACPGLLYAGTETGLYISFDDGERWERFQSNLPVCPIHDLIVHDHDLLVATHGRSFWILDDLTPLRALARDRATAPRLFQPRDTIRFQVYRGFGEGEGAEVSYRMAGPVTYAYKQREKSDGTKDIKLLNAGQNPPDGVLIAYELAEPVAGELTVTILDGDDREIRRFSSNRAKQPDENRDQDTESGPGAERTDAAEVGEGSEVLADAEEDIEGQKPFLSTEAGIHRFVWNFRCENSTRIPGDKSAEFTTAGPRVPPGTYRARLTIGDADFTESFQILADPRVEASATDFAAQFEFGLRIRDAMSRMNEAIIGLRDVRDQLVGWEKRLSRLKEAGEERAEAKRLTTRLTAIEEELLNTKSSSRFGYPPPNVPTRLQQKLAMLAAMNASADAAPTKQSSEVLDALLAQVDAQLKTLDELLRTDLAALNESIRNLNLPAIQPRPLTDEDPSPPLSN
jgi:photosystem II stability/assembly factor-like uncharacterized protein